jgi:hypothetical protein
MKDIMDVLTEEEIDYLKKNQACPLCGFEFVGYPTGWAWQNHIKACLKAVGRWEGA